jgi:hypothetical protein
MTGLVGATRWQTGVTQPETVLIRAFRGTRRKAVYRDHAFGRAAFACIRERLPLLRSLDEDRVELDKADARRLAAEISRLRRDAVLLELDDDLTAIGALARWCARAGEAAWLRIERR